jgi:NADPH-dependent curcumin reductase CurA
MPATGANRQWILKTRPSGPVTEDCFEWREVETRAPGDGEVLIRNLMLSFDPTQRGWMSEDTYVPKVPLGEVMRAGSVGQVVESRKDGIEAGDLVQGAFGWQDYTTTDGGGFMPMSKLPRGTPLNLAMGVLGITGLTAYFGTLEIGLPQAGETFVVSGAAGATGSVAGMIAKIKGCRVVGIAGGKSKCEWIKSEGGFDEAIDYKSESVSGRLRELCPDGIDIYFDNVGGQILNQALARIAPNARIILCGAISGYESSELPPGPANYFNLVLKHGRMEGFLVLDYLSKFREGIAQLAEWHGEGKIKQLEDIQEGLENAPRTFMRLFSGANMGKQLLKIADPA